MLKETYSSGILLSSALFSYLYIKCVGGKITIPKCSSLSSEFSAAIIGGGLTVTEFLLYKIFSRRFSCSLSGILFLASKKFIQIANKDTAAIFLISFFHQHLLKPPSNKKNIIDQIEETDYHSASSTEIMSDIESDSELSQTKPIDAWICLTQDEFQKDLAFMKTIPNADLNKILSYRQGDINFFYLAFCNIFVHKDLNMILDRLGLLEPPYLIDGDIRDPNYVYFKTSIMCDSKKPNSVWLPSILLFDIDGKKIDPVQFTMNGSPYSISLKKIVNEQRKEIKFFSPAEIINLRKYKRSFVENATKLFKDNNIFSLVSDTTVEFIGEMQGEQIAFKIKPYQTKHIAPEKDTQRICYTRENRSIYFHLEGYDLDFLLKNLIILFDSKNQNLWIYLPRSGHQPPKASLFHFDSLKTPSLEIRDKKLYLTS